MTAPNSIIDLSISYKKACVKKRDILLQAGQKSNYTYQVTKGCLKSYVIDKSGKEHILHFAPEGWLIGDMNSFLNNAEATINIDVIEDYEIIMYDKTVFSQAKTFPLEIWEREVKRMQNNIIALNKRLVNLLSSTAEERYLDFIETYPMLIQRLPLKLSASYLGITPEFLSRIRKRMAQKKDRIS